MSWRITMGGHSDLEPEEETKEVNALAASMMAQAVDLGLNPTDGMTSTPTENLTFEQLRDRALEEIES